MKRMALIFGWILLVGWSVKAQDIFQLAPPLLKYESVFFEKSATVRLQFAQAETHIHYTLNGATPTESDPVYLRPLHLKKQATTLKARVFGNGFLPSKTIEVTFFKAGLPIAKLNHPPPNESYAGSGPTTLFDNQGGVVDYANPTWMGFQQEVIPVEITFTKPQKVRQLLLHTLQNQDAWIFLPQKVEVFYQKPGNEAWILMDTKTLDAAQKAGHPACQSVLMSLDSRVKTQRLLIKIYPLAQIPEGHEGQGKPAWLFLDEIKLY